MQRYGTRSSGVRGRCGLHGISRAGLGKIAIPPALLLCFLYGPAYAVSPEDFAVRVTGGGVACAGDLVEAEVVVDLNRTGSNRSPVRGFSLAVCHVSYQLQIEEALPGAAIDPQQGGTDVDFLQITVKDRGVIEAVIVDLHENRGLEPQNDLPVLALRYRVKDAAGGAAIAPCNGTLNTPPVMITFSTGTESYIPPPENLLGTTVTSPCDPPDRKLHLSVEQPEELTVLCGTHQGKTFLTCSIREEPVACCPPHLVSTLHLTFEVPPDLRITRVLQGDIPIVKGKIEVLEGRTEVEVTFLPSARFPQERVAAYLQLESVPENWPDRFEPTERVIRLLGGDSTQEAGVLTVRGEFLPFEESGTLAVTVPVVSWCPAFRRGDANADGKRDIGDAIAVLTWLYAGTGSEPPCRDAADSNDDGTVDIADAIALLYFLYGGSPSLAEPIDRCGADPTADDLDCRDFPPCGSQ